MFLPWQSFDRLPLPGLPLPQLNGFSLPFPPSSESDFSPSGTLSSTMMLSGGRGMSMCMVCCNQTKLLWLHAAGRVWNVKHVKYIFGSEIFGNISGSTYNMKQKITHERPPPPWPGPLCCKCEPICLHCITSPGIPPNKRQCCSAGAGFNSAYFLRQLSQIR